MNNYRVEMRNSECAQKYCNVVAETAATAEWSPATTTPRTGLYGADCSNKGAKWICARGK
jgi:hypothetical protein